MIAPSLQRMNFAGRAWLLLLLGGILSAGNAPLLTTVNPTGIRPVSSSEEAPTEETEAGTSAPLYLVHPARRARRARCKDLVALSPTTSWAAARGAVSARDRWAVFAPSENAMRFGLGAPLRI